MTFVLLMILNACSSRRIHHFEELLAQNKCEEAILNIPDTTVQKVENFSTEALGKPVSYILTGLGHTVDYTLLVSSGIVTVAVACSPFLLSSLASNSHSSSSLGLGCLPVNFLVKTNLGDKMYKHTENLRCTDVDHMSQALRKISDCYASTGNNEKALLQLANLKEDPYYKKCLSSKEYQSVIDQYYLLYDLSKNVNEAKDLIRS